MFVREFGSREDHLTPGDTVSVDPVAESVMGPDLFGDDPPDLASLVKSQAKLALTLQKRVEQSPHLDVKELKDIATACSTLVNNVHRTGEILRELETYKLFHAVVIDFIKRRSDSFGEDLLAELSNVASEMAAKSQLKHLL